MTPRKDAWGVCEYHKGTGWHCKDVALTKIEENESKEWYYQNIFKACSTCREERIKGRYLVIKMPKIKEKKIGEIFPCKATREMVTMFLDLQPIFSGVIDGIFVIPDSSIRYDRFKDKTNILVRIPHLDLTCYVATALKNKKNLIEFWNDGDVRKDRFWSVRTTKLLLTLAEVHHKSKYVNVWIQGYAKIVSIELMSRMRLFQVIPKKMYRVKR